MSGYTYFAVPMKRYIRILAGIFALLAMTFSFTESVVASTCGPMPDMAASAETHHAENTSGAGAACLFARMHRSGDQRNAEGHCPFGPAMGSDCASAPSLPSAAPVVSVVASEAAEQPPSDAVRPSRLLAHAVFHPPRA